jgi:hypothetical protein
MKRRAIDQLVVLFLWLGICYLVPFLRSQISTPMLLARYTIVYLAVLMLLPAMGLNLLESRRNLYIFLIALFISSGINTFLVKKHYSRIYKEQWRETSMRVAADNRTTQFPVYSFWDKYYTYYFRKYAPSLTVRNPAGKDFVKELESVAGVWVLSGHNNMDIFGRQASLSLSQIQYLRNQFTEVKHYSFHSCTATLYARNP